jgi:hypothetical protein
VLGGYWSPHDDGSRPSMHDVDVHTTEGRHTAVEVTSAADADALRTREALRRAEETMHGYPLERPWSASIWTLTQVRPLQRRLPGLLVRAEAAGVEHLYADWSYDDPVLAALAAELGALGVMEIDAIIAAGQPGSVHLRHASRLHPVAAQALTGTLEGVLAKTDNQRKLATADAHERDLFVFLDDRSGAVIDADHRPPACPDDPLDVLDRRWIYTAAASAWLHAAAPGAEWQRYVAATGRPWPYA